MARRSLSAASSSLVRVGGRNDAAVALALVEPDDAAADADDCGGGADDGGGAALGALGALLLLGADVGTGGALVGGALRCGAVDAGTGGGAASPLVIEARLESNSACLAAF